MLTISETIFNSVMDKVNLNDLSVPEIWMTHTSDV